MKILIINAGSSSAKFTLYEEESLLAKGLIERLGTPEARLKYSNNRNQKIEKSVTANSFEAAIRHACLALDDKETGVIEKLTDIDAIGHRVVHGGDAISSSARITPGIKQIIRDNFSLAPLHNPPNMEGIEACEALFPNTPMVAVFDTAFHQSMPAAAYTYALPAELAEKHKIRRYGFHGTSHHYVTIQAANLLGRRVDEVKLITTHLGNGCSITAVNKGNVEDTSMGLTPLEGLVMGTRSGDIDPGVVLFLLRLGYSTDDVDKLLNKSSGIKGVARNGSSDMRDLIDSVEQGDKQAQLAFDILLHRLVKYIGAYAAVLNGFDALVFTAGIGENCSKLRASVCNRLGCLGITLDPAKNKANEHIISKESSSPIVMAVPTNEELMIARETMRVLEA